jgi:hypothetical protein
MDFFTLNLGRALACALLSLVVAVAPLATQALPNGEIKTVADSFTSHIRGPTEDLVPYLGAELGDRYRLTPQWRLEWRVLGVSSFSADGPPENFYADVPMGFLEFQARADLKFRVGMNTTNWAVVNLHSPSDVVNNISLFHPLRAHKQAAPMAEVEWGSETLNLDLIYIPLYRDPELPSRNSRWLPRSFLMNMQQDGRRIVIPDKLEYRWDNPQTLGQANQNFGGKLATHLGSWDLQATYFRGLAPSPKVIPTTLDVESVAGSGEETAHSPIHLTSYSYITETTGGGFHWSGEVITVRGESAYQHTVSRSPLLQAWSWSNALTVETEITIYQRPLTMQMGGFYASNPQAADNLISSAYRMFDRSAVLGGRLRCADDLTLLASVLYETKTRGVFWMAGFERKLKGYFFEPSYDRSSGRLSGPLSWGVSWRDFSAQRDGLLRTYDRNDHFTLEMSYLF